MHKRSSWIFVLFSILIIAGVGSCLIFWPKNDKEHVKPDNDIVQDDNNASDNNQDNTNDEDNDKIGEEETFATSLVVNLPNSINILIGTEVKLLSGYIQVQPSGMINNVSTTIVPKYQSPSNGLKFEDTYLKANAVGTYSLILSVDKSANEQIRKTITVSVYDDKNDAHVIQKCNVIIKNVKTDINDLFIFNANNFEIDADNSIVYEDGKLNGIATGTSVVDVSVTESYLQYIYQFNVKIKEQPLYTIVLNNVVDNKVEIDINDTSIYFINYKIINRNEENVSQEVTARIDDASVAVVENITEPLIKVRAKAGGTTTLTIICDADNSVFVEIEIIVK